jgi:hypothetical protein
MSLWGLNLLESLRKTRPCNCLLPILGPMVICAGVFCNSNAVSGQSLIYDHATDTPQQKPCELVNERKLNPTTRGPEILSDTRGVDFGPYIKGSLHSIYALWVTYIPAEGRPPTNASASTLIRFTIAQDGTLREMHLDGGSHNPSFDRAAWGAITGVGKFQPLPKAFDGPSLELRVMFSVNCPPPTK